MTVLRYISLGLLLAVVLPLQAQNCRDVDPDALAWLDRMSHSLREVSYEGVFTYEHGNSMQAMRISHSVENGAESEELTDLSGSRASIVRSSHPLDCVHPGHRLLRVGPGFSRGGEDCGLGEFYRLRMAGENRVAGRNAVILQILPRDMYRYGYQMALDQETGLLLKSQTLAQDGKILERFQFADIRLGTPGSAGTRVDVIHHAGHPTGVEESASPDTGLDTGGWQVHWVPEGFTPTGAMAGESFEKTFTDGLAVFSVYLEPGKPSLAPGEGRARLGGTSAYTRGRALQGRSVLITVVGEIPVNTARIVASKVSLAVR